VQAHIVMMWRGVGIINVQINVKKSIVRLWRNEEIDV